MATTNKLTITFAGELGTSITMSYKYVKADITGQQVQALINAIIENNAIYARKPITAKTAKLQEIEETEFILS